MDEPTERTLWRAYLPALALLAVIVLATGLRLHALTPPATGALYAADADEGIYAASARLALDGYLPYRDFFCSAPPVALYLYMATLAPTSPQWGDLNGFMALRYMSVVYGIVTILAVYATARRLGGQAAGLLAALLLAADGWVIAQDRRAMLEAPLNMFSTLAVLALVVATQRQQRNLRWYALAGTLAALAILSKTQGLTILVVLLLTLAIQRRWRPLLVTGGAAACAYVLLSLPFLLTAADDFIRQLLIFQFLRPPNGDPAIMLRVNAIRNFPEAWLTVRLGLLGAGLLVVRWLWQARWRTRAASSGGWLPTLLWAGLIAASFVASKTFYLYYYAQLAVPLALLGGSLLAPWFAGKTAGSTARRWADPRILTIVAIAALALWRAPLQARSAVAATEWQKTAYAGVAEYLRAGTAQDASVLAFEPNYTFLGSRPLARLADGTFPVDSHAYMLYLNLDIKNQTWPALLGQVAHRQMADEQTLLWQQPAQDAVLSARAQYAVIDRRARYLLSPATLETLQAASDELATYSDVTVRRMHAP